MPIPFNYSCKDCGYTWELFQLVRKCPKCDSSNINRTQHSPYVYEKI